jgi:phosphoglycolate phosphatase-like HAD superfamily hydrolase
MKQPKLIIFDMDGVIIDVSRSYREAVRKTAFLFLQGAKGSAQLPDPLFPLSDLARLKQTGGLNNDWDLAALTISLLFSLIPTPAKPEITASLSCYEESIRHCDVSSLAAFLNRSSSPLMELLGKYGRLKNPFVTDCYKGDVGSGNIIKQIFQEIYLGQNLFPMIYPLPSRFFKEEGLISQESLLIDNALFEDIARRHILAIATGRPRMEALYALDHFRIRDYFQRIITLDDCIEEEERLLRERGEQVSLSKPDPFMLDMIWRQIGKDCGGCYYLGDTPDDIRAAISSKTGFTGIGVVLSSPDPENLQQDLLEAGADCIIRNDQELRRYLG